jgi:hypothetical protein
MKLLKVTLIAVAILIGTNAGAQNSPVTFGVKGGVNLSNFRGDVEQNKPIFGFNAGVTMDYAFAPGMYLMTGLELTTKGTKQEEKEDGDSWKETMSPMYLQLPVHFGYKIDVAPGTRVVLHAGPYVAYGIGGKSTIKLNGKEIGSTNIFSDTEIDGEKIPAAEAFDYGVGLGTGIEFGKITIGLGYDLGLANFTGVKEVKMHNMNAALTVGYKF